MRSPTTSAARSTRSWSRARSPAAWRKASAARCYEEFLYDETGEPLSVTFADYLMPTAREMPELSILVTEDAPSPLNPLGLKGAGEGGANPVGAAIASAIDDALRPPRRGDATAGDAAAAEGADGESRLAPTAGFSCAAARQ